jgi:YfiH family protein
LTPADPAWLVRPQGLGEAVEAALTTRPLDAAAQPAAVAAAIGLRPVWLRQVHGRDVVRLQADTPDGLTADAAWTTATGIACVVRVADCLPVLFAAEDGSAVAAAHAGWRGLAAGVLEATLAALAEGTGRPASRFVAWLGPCIGPRQFEVGRDVLDVFAGFEQHFTFRPRPDGDARWLADLPALAEQRLRGAGVTRFLRDGRCTVESASAFFSFRRDGSRGRMAAAIWRGGGG